MAKDKAALGSAIVGFLAPLLVLFLASVFLALFWFTMHWIIGHLHNFVICLFRAHGIF